MNNKVFLFSLLYFSLCFSQNVFNVLDFGAKGDGRTVDTVPVQNAINAVTKSQKQGTVLFPPGNYLTGPVNLTSNMVLHVSKGATILALPDTKAYAILPPFPSYGIAREAGTVNRFEPVIGGYNLTQVTIEGGGTINGQGAYWWNLFQNKELKQTRPRLLEFQWCSYLNINNIQIENSPFWTVHPIYCDNVHIKTVKIRSPPDSPNTDGIDPDSSTNVLIEDVDISCGDDMIAVKSGMRNPGTTLFKPTVNVTIRDSVFGSGHGLSVGSETSGGIMNITFTNLKVDGAFRGPNIKTSRGRGNVIEHVVYSDITMKNLSRFAIGIGMNYDKVPNPGNSTTTPIVRDITFQNIVGTSDGSAGSLECLPESPCYSITLDKIDIKPSSGGFECQYIHGHSSDVSPTSCVN